MSVVSAKLNTFEICNILTLSLVNCFLCFVLHLCVYFVIYIEFSLFFVYQQQSSDWLWRPAASEWPIYCEGWGVKGLNSTQTDPIVSYLYQLNNEICRPADMTNWQSKPIQYFVTSYHSSEMLVLGLDVSSRTKQVLGLGSWKASPWLLDQLTLALGGKSSALNIKSLLTIVDMQ